MLSNSLSICFTLLVYVCKHTSCCMAFHSLSKRQLYYSEQYCRYVQRCHFYRKMSCVGFAGVWVPGCFSWVPASWCWACKTASCEGGGSGTNRTVRLWAILYAGQWRSHLEPSASLAALLQQCSGVFGGTLYLMTACGEGQPPPFVSFWLTLRGWHHVGSPAWWSLTVAPCTSRKKCQGHLGGMCLGLLLTHLMAKFSSTCWLDRMLLLSILSFLELDLWWSTNSNSTWLISQTEQVAIKLQIEFYFILFFLEILSLWVKQLPMLLQHAEIVAIPSLAETGEEQTAMSSWGRKRTIRDLEKSSMT